MNLKFNKQGWKWVSGQVHLLQVAILVTWEGLPQDLKQYLPPKILVGIVMAAGAFGFVSNFIDKENNKNG